MMNKNPAGTGEPPDPMFGNYEPLDYDIHDIRWHSQKRGANYFKEVVRNSDRPMFQKAFQNTYMVLL